jgi:hypothetical protein
MDEKKLTALARLVAAIAKLVDAVSGGNGFS